MKFCNLPGIGIAVTRSVPSSFRHAFLSAVLASLAACANMPSPSSASAQPAPAIVSMDEWLSRGDTALKAGDHSKARDAWRAAAKDYPTATEPWLRLSQDYFDASDYGNAVLAAQEALQRDPHDRLANSVLAVSGLRITAGSLASLRDDGEYAVGSRDEAVAVTHALRETLGEPVLVPAPEASARKRPAKVPRPARRASATAEAVPPALVTAAAAPAPAVAQRPAAVAPVGSNPLDKLK